MTWERHHARVSAIVPPVLTAPLSSRRSLNETAAWRLPVSSRDGSQGRALWARPAAPAPTQDGPSAPLHEIF